MSFQDLTLLTEIHNFKYGFVWVLIGYGINIRTKEEKKVGKTIQTAASSRNEMCKESVLEYKESRSHLGS